MNRMRRASPQQAQEDILGRIYLTKQLGILEILAENYSELEDRIADAATMEELEAVGLELSPYFDLVAHAGLIMTPHGFEDPLMDVARQMRRTYQQRASELKARDRKEAWKKKISSERPLPPAPQAAPAKVIDISTRASRTGQLPGMAEEDKCADPAEAIPKTSQENLAGKVDKNYVEINNPRYLIAREYIKMVANKSAYAATLLGEGGLGKTQLIVHELERGRFPYTFYNGKITPATLYEFLARKNNDNLVIVFDDVRSLIANDDMINMMKGALWDNDGKSRTIQYNSKFPLDHGIPKTIDFRSRIIFTFNKINKDDPDVDALIGRTLYVELYLNYDEKIKAMQDIARNGYATPRYVMSPEECLIATDFIMQNSNSSTERFNFRTQKQIFDFYVHYQIAEGRGSERWKDLALAKLSTGG